MTQDVQPLTWQKRTNLEEHQQFFSKINEIIDNLAPTVDEAEAAIAQATAAIASANDAIATANAASAAASAAASQAQTAASTVAGYDTRLTAVEGEADTNADNITALQGRMGTAEGNITAIEGREADYLKKAGAAQTVTSQIMVPTTATGVRDTQIANGTRIQNDLAAYEYMLRTVNNQTADGVKEFLKKIVAPVMGYIWNEYPAPRYNWCLVASVEGYNQYTHVEVTSTAGDHAEFAFYNSNTGVNGNVICAGGASGVNVAVAYDNGVTSLYIKVPREMNWCVIVTSHDRYRNGVRWTVNTAIPADSHIDELPALSLNLVIP